LHQLKQPQIWTTQSLSPVQLVQVNKELISNNVIFIRTELLHFAWVVRTRFP
jgi:hypothetical protein